MTPSPRIGIYGLGNVLRRDDGFGPTVVAMLEASHDLPPGVVLEDLGTPGLDLASWFVGLDAAIVLDAIEALEPPGTLRTFRRDDLPPAPAGSPRVTNHEGDLREALAIADLHGSAPRDVLLIGAVAADLAQGPGLSPAMEGAVDGAIAAVLAELARLGVRPALRDVPAPAATWWRSAGGPVPPCKSKV